jgi:copper chaperone
MTEVTYKFNVEMACSGCSGAVERALKKNPNVTSVQADLGTQTVTVKASDALSYDAVFDIIKATGKKVTKIDS